MTDEVKDMISKALRDEPPVGVSYESVLAAGKRRRTRRQVVITGGAALGVAAVVSAAMLVGQRFETSTLTPASPTTLTSAVPEPASGCAFPQGTGGFSDSPTGVASPEALAESARLTGAFARFRIPLPPGVTMDPAKPRFCAIKDSWGTQVTLHSPQGDRALFIEVRPSTLLRAGPCPPPDKVTACSTRRLADGGSARITDTLSPAPSLPVLVDAWRTDGTVRVMEAGAVAPNQTPRILDNNTLVAIASAAELKPSWPVRLLPAEASSQRATALTDELIKSAALGQGVLLPPGFVVSQGGYKLNLDITDGTGTGSVFINLNPPDAAAIVCDNQPGCDLITLPDKRKASVIRIADRTSQRLMLSTKAADGTQVFIMTTNQSLRAQDQGKTGGTRPTPPMSIDDLIRIAGQTWLHW